MNILINGRDTDITLEEEKKIGDVLSGIEAWLDGSGHHVSGITVDGEEVNARSFSGFLERDIAGVRDLRVTTSSWAELAVEALLDTRRDAGNYENAEFGERARFSEKWKESPEAGHLEANFPDLYRTALAAFSGETLDPGSLRSLIDERIREMKDPVGELGLVSKFVEEAAVRLEDLPLDIQTGKDGRAAETVQIFSALAEKIFRIFGIQRAEGFEFSRLMVEGVPVYTYVEEFGTALKELLEAYESKDVVLVGDLAEYELAPRLRNIYRAISGPETA
ncbi:MAG: hypothetical protein LBL44_02360 [Treponema sp.]|jgi:hypothetical protein|nr:hypothetical protein [Treponema sp.]